MARSDSDVGPGVRSGVMTLFFLVLVGCLAFLTADFRHRADGYRAVVEGKGVLGTVSVTQCEQTRLGDYCTGTFTSADGQTVKTGMRVNGADNAGVVRDAVLSEKGSLWTASGKPWMRPSPALLGAVAPVALAFTLLYGTLRAGRSGLRARRMRGDLRKSAAKAKETKLGRVH